MSDPEFIFVFHKLSGTQIFLRVAKGFRLALTNSGGVGAGDQTYVASYIVPLC